MGTDHLTSLAFRLKHRDNAENCAATGQLPVYKRTPATIPVTGKNDAID